MSNNEKPSSFNTEQWEPLVGVLRLEIQEYGALLNLILEQQHCIMARETEALIVITDKIEEQGFISKQACQNREKIVNLLANTVGFSDNVSLKVILGFFPEKIQSMLKALTEEIQTLCEKTQYKAKQNHLLLSRAYEVTEQLLRMVKPSLCKTYNKKGTSQLRTSCESVCLSTSS